MNVCCSFSNAAGIPRRRITPSRTVRCRTMTDRFAEFSASSPKRPSASSTNGGSQSSTNSGPVSPARKTRRRCSAHPNEPSPQIPAICRSPRSTCSIRITRRVWCRWLASTPEPSWRRGPAWTISRRRGDSLPTTTGIRRRSCPRLPSSTGPHAHGTNPRPRPLSCRSGNRDNPGWRECSLAARTRTG